MENLMSAVEQIPVDEIENSSLLDCYRIALDFGMPAALKAYEKLAFESVNYTNDSNIED
tara:strand:- start:335 stop:511 length:177 start_codon:yes stop_codon:yes gene_type:complete